MGCSARWLRAPADVTLTATVKNTAKAKPRTLVKPTPRKALPAGKPQTFVLTLSKSAKASLRKGATISVIVNAKGASGWAAGQTTTAKVK